jgi:hypothetical protein
VLHTTRAGRKLCQDVAVFPAVSSILSVACFSLPQKSKAERKICRNLLIVVCSKGDSF